MFSDDASIVEQHESGIAGVFTFNPRQRGGRECGRFATGR
jgi:hypothetical protein